MGILHAGILNALPFSTVTAVAEKEGMLTRFAKKLLPTLRFYSSAQDMLAIENDLDAVYITTPISSHRPIIEGMALTHRRLGVFVEKPLAGNYADAYAIASCSAQLGGCNMVGFQKRFSPIFQKGRNLLCEGILGELTSFTAYSFASAVFGDGTGWRQKEGQGGALLDLGPHLIDALMWYFGKPVSVEGRAGSLYSREVDDFARGVIHFSPSIRGEFEVSWSREGYRLPEIGIEISGNNGKMKVTDDYLRLELRANSLGMAAGKHLFRKPEFRTNVDFLIGDPEYCSEDKYFLDCLRLGNLPQPDFATGAAVNDIIERILHNSANAEVAG